MVKKQCECGKSEVKVPCSQATSSCGQFCGRSLKCGHKCPKMCHKEGECAAVCTKICARLLRCGHRHSTVKCHFPKQCQGPPPAPPPTPAEAAGAEGSQAEQVPVVSVSGIMGKSPCSEKLKLQCKCGNLMLQKICTGERPPSLLLECDDSCAILERNRMLANAFGVDTTINPVRNSLDPTVKVEDLYSEDLIDLYLSNPAWCRDIETKLTIMYTTQARVRRFPPMKAYERMFVHILSNEAFNFKSESQDTDPHRSVVVYGDWHSMSDETYPRKPSMTIAEYVSRANIS